MGDGQNRGRLIVDEVTSRRFGSFPRRDTTPELLVRRALHGAGIRFRVHNRDLPGSPDLANRRARWVVFVHGCYWHHHEGCPRATVPKRNREFWSAKFAANRERDARVARRLEDLGFLVVQIWECETQRPAALARALTRITVPPAVASHTESARSTSPSGGTRRPSQRASPRRPRP